MSSSACNAMVLPEEQGVFTYSFSMQDYFHSLADKGKGRFLANYYSNRAFPGAPPRIPHTISNEMTYGGKNCLQCHQNGGYVPPLNAYAPLTPHPNLVNCRQCHVPVNTMDLFAGSDFPKIQAPPLGFRALKGSPPQIPHTLQLRENCLACHGGPGAPKEIRVSHPERVNCRQCHAEKKNVVDEWTRTNQN